MAGRLVALVYVHLITCPGLCLAVFVYVFLYRGIAVLFAQCAQGLL